MPGFTLGMGLGLGESRAPFTRSPIAALFTTGVNGVWYDPSDLSTMFQNAAGTTPVTAVGQPVGLMLDKSKGLVLGPELVTNGDFSFGAGWSASAGWSIAGDKAVATAAASGASLNRGIAVTTGVLYKVQYTISDYVNGSFALKVGGALGAVRSANGTYTEYTVAGAGGLVELQVRTIGGSTLSVDNVSVRELPGNHAFNPSGNSANFPVLQQDGTGRYYLAFNGVNQWLQTNSIDFTYDDKMFVSAGVRKLSDAAAGVFCELSPNWNTNNGSFSVQAPPAAADRYYFVSKGTIGSTATVLSGYPAPITNIISSIGDISAPNAVLRINGFQAAQSTATQGTGNFGNYPLYIGARAGFSLWFNGRLYGLVVAGKAASASEIASTEAWLNQKTGAY